jgi:hypothetical protein
MSLESLLLAAPTRWMFRSASWRDDISLEGGVYVIWDAHLGSPAYVGESACLRDRIGDAGRVVNHTFRRRTAERLNIDSKDAQTISLAMSKRYKLAFVEVQLGRAELEEYLRVRWRDTITNGPAKRMLRGVQYKWVTQSSPTLGPGRR